MPIYYLTVAMGQMSGHSVAKQGFLCLQSHKAEIKVSARLHAFLEL